VPFTGKLLLLLLLLLLSSLPLFLLLAHVCVNLFWRQALQHTRAQQLKQALAHMRSGHPCRTCLVHKPYNVLSTAVRTAASGIA
jgi:hypothetical protein